jgi:flagellar hook assembly protein FlgD
VSLGIYNIKGQLVKELNKGFLNKGHHEYQWDGKDQMGEMCASGVYFARLRSTSQSMIRKMLMIK